MKWFIVVAMALIAPPLYAQGEKAEGLYQRFKQLIEEGRGAEAEAEAELLKMEEEADLKEQETLGKENRDEEIGATFWVTEEAQVVTFNVKLDETEFELHGVVDHGADPQTLCLHSNLPITEKDLDRIGRLAGKYYAGEGPYRSFSGLLAWLRVPGDEIVGEIIDFDEEWASESPTSDTFNTAN